LILAAIGAALYEFAVPMEELDLIFAEQICDAVIVLLDHVGFAREHSRKIESQPLDLNAVVRELVTGMLVILRRLQERLGRYAATFVQVPPSAGLPSACSQRLCKPSSCRVDRAYGCYVTARTAADHYHIKCLCHWQALP
jgi:hypothetical protein